MAVLIRARKTLPGGTPGFRVRVVLPSGNTAIYDVSERLFPKPRVGCAVADFDRATTDTIRYGEQIAVLMLDADRAYRWVKVRRGAPDLIWDREHFADVPKVSDVLAELPKSPEPLGL